MFLGSWGVGKNAIANQSAEPPDGTCPVLIDIELWNACKELHALRNVVEIDVRALPDPVQHADAGVLWGAGLLLAGHRRPDGSGCDGLLRWLRTLNPHAGRFVVGTKASGIHRSMSALAKAGADQVFIADHTFDMRVMFEQARRRVQAPPPEDAIRCSATALAGKGSRPMALHALRNSYLHKRVAELAEWGRTHADTASRGGGRHRRGARAVLREWAGRGECKRQSQTRRNLGLRMSCMQAACGASVRRCAPRIPTT